MESGVASAVRLRQRIGEGAAAKRRSLEYKYSRIGTSWLISMKPPPLEVQLAKVRPLLHGARSFCALVDVEKVVALLEEEEFRDEG